MAVSSNSIKVASVTVIAMIQGFTADRSALAPGKGREAAIGLILMSASMPPLMRQQTVRSHLTLWYDAVSDQSVAQHLPAGEGGNERADSRGKKLFGRRRPPSIREATTGTS